jgi:hypothetical protein
MGYETYNIVDNLGSQMLYVQGYLIMVIFAAIIKIIGIKI